MGPLILSLPGNESIADAIAVKSKAERAELTLRRFPDGEIYVRIETPVTGREVILVCTLHRPDEKILPLMLVAAAAKDLGALRVGLVAPYLAYMRQDRRFKPGEGVTSLYFARLLSTFIDWLVTVDPHLHRRNSLDEIYPVHTAVVHAAPRISEWIRTHVKNPVLVGPDSESAQWVRAVAGGAGAPYLVLEKMRRGDLDVEVSVPDAEQLRNHTPVLVDDIISTARTMIETIRNLRREGLAEPVCVGVHAVFSDDAYDELKEAGAAQVVTCNTISHSSNAIDLTDLLAESLVGICATSF